jgi:hypothetical protein
VFWDTAPGSLFVIDRHFRCAYCLHHQGDEIAVLHPVNISQGLSSVPIIKTAICSRGGNKNCKRTNRKQGISAAKNKAPTRRNEAVPEDVEQQRVCAKQLFASLALVLYAKATIKPKIRERIGSVSWNMFCVVS